MRRDLFYTCMNTTLHKISNKIPTAIVEREYILEVSLGRQHLELSIVFDINRLACIRITRRQRHVTPVGYVSRARSSAGEHCVDIAGVAGSIPAVPTILFNDLAGVDL